MLPIPVELITNILKYLDSNDLMAFNEECGSVWLEARRELHSRVMNCISRNRTQEISDILDRAGGEHAGEWMSNLFQGVERQVVLSACLQGFICSCHQNQQEMMDDWLSFFLHFNLNKFELAQVYEVYPILGYCPYLQPITLMHAPSQETLRWVFWEGIQSWNPRHWTWLDRWTKIYLLLSPEEDNGDFMPVVQEIRWMLKKFPDRQGQLVTDTVSDDCPDILLALRNDPDRKPDELYNFFQMMCETAYEDDLLLYALFDRGGNVNPANCVQIVEDFFQPNGPDCEDYPAKLGGMLRKMAVNPQWPPAFYLSLVCLLPNYLINDREEAKYAINLTTNNNRPFYDPRLPERVTQFLLLLGHYHRNPAKVATFISHFVSEMTGRVGLDEQDGFVIAMLREMISRLDLMEPGLLVPLMTKLNYHDNPGMWSKVLHHIFQTDGTDNIFHASWRELFGHLFAHDWKKSVSTIKRSKIPSSRDKVHVNLLMLAAFPYTTLVDAFGFARDLMNFIPEVQHEVEDAQKSVINDHHHRHPLAAWFGMTQVVRVFLVRLDSPRSIFSPRDMARMLMDEIGVDNQEDADLLIEHGLVLHGFWVRQVKLEVKAYLKAKQKQQAKLTMSMKMIFDEDLASTTQTALQNRTNLKSPIGRYGNMSDSSPEKSFVKPLPLSAPTLKEPDSPDETFGKPRRLFSKSPSPNASPNHALVSKKMRAIIFESDDEQ
jgi:hypothetical protein